jgi:hypothetical protein
MNYLGGYINGSKINKELAQDKNETDLDGLFSWYGESCISKKSRHSYSAWMCYYGSK